MTKLVTLTLTDTDCLSLRLALNATAMEWGDKASAARHAGNDVDAATCERVRSDYHRLWDMVNVAQEAPGRVQDWNYRQPSTDARLAWFDVDAVGKAIEYLDLAHGESNADVNGVIERLYAGARVDAP